LSHSWALCRIRGIDGLLDTRGLSMGMNRFRSLAAAGAIVALAAVTGCSTPQSQSAEAADPIASDLQAEAERAIEAASGALEFQAPGPAVDASEVKGSAVKIVAVDLFVPALSAINDSFTGLAGQLGVEVDTFNAKSQVNQMQLGVRQAINARADAIVLLGVPADLVRPELLDAEAKGIPVINVINNQPDAGQPGQGAGEGFYATVAPDFVASGQLVAYHALLNAGADTTALLITSPELQPAAPVMEGFKSVLDECEECTVIEKEVPLEKWGTDITPLVISTIRANPDLDYVLPIFDDMAVMATAGVQQASATGKVRVASLNASPAALELVKDGKVLTADPGISNDWAAWATMDQSIRGILDLEPADPVVPTRFIDTEVLASADSATPEAVLAADYREGFLELWKQ
jgi:ribose transport system substrate-binding protein